MGIYYTMFKLSKKGGRRLLYLVKVLAIASPLGKGKVLAIASPSGSP
jgi:hypothetical protein